MLAIKAVPAAPSILRLLIAMSSSPSCFKSCVNIAIYGMFHKIAISEQPVHHSHASINARDTQRLKKPQSPSKWEA